VQNDVVVLLRQRSNLIDRQIVGGASIKPASRTIAPVAPATWDTRTTAPRGDIDSATQPAIETFERRGSRTTSS